ncbi:hypothetical protein ABPG74_008483 [Tetrahymena malaccensis]
MDQSLDDLIQDCNNLAFNIKKQKLDLISKLGEDAPEILKAVSAIYVLDRNTVNELRAFKCPPQTVMLTLETYRILTLNSESDLQNYQFTEYELNKKKFTVPSVSPQNDWNKMLIMMRNLYEDLKKFDFKQTINPNSIKILDQLDFSEDGPFAIKHVERYSLLARIIIIIVKLTYKLAKSQNQPQSQVSYKYQDLMNLIKSVSSQQLFNKVFSLEQYLKNNQSSSQKNEAEEVSLNKTIFDVQIENILNILQQKIQIRQFCSDFTSFFNFNIEFNQWINSKRPLTYWYEVDETNEFQKLQELIDYIKYSNENQIQNPYNKIGFDFLLLLRKHELKQIQKLSFNCYSDQQVKKIIVCLKYLYELNLKKLEANERFYQVVFLEKELAVMFCEFLKNQKEIEQFYFNYTNYFNQKFHFSVLTKTIKSLKYLKKLRFHYTDSQITEKQFFKIQEAIQSLPLLESLDIKITQPQNQNGENLYELPITLKKLSLYINGKGQINYGYNIPKLSLLKNLRFFKLKFEYEWEEVNSPSLIEMLNDIKNLKLYHFEFKCDCNLPLDLHQKLAQKFYKLKRLVKLNISPSIKDLFEQEINYDE